MKKFLLLVSLTIIFISCSSTKKTTSSQKRRIHHTKKISKTDKIIRTALSFKGTKYKYGGTSQNGMDCSGLVFTSFLKENITLPRVSSAMAKVGERISLHDIKKGDLLFFKTSRKNRINHVGIVTSIKNGRIKFVHSSSSKGVIESFLSEKYWKKAYSKAKRIL